MEQLNQFKKTIINKKNRFIIRYERSLLKNRDFSIISQNCIGGVFYHDMGMQFTSPTINLFFKTPDFMRFVMNLEYYMEQDLRMVQGNDYPHGFLDDIEVFFQHYDSCETAKEQWEDRKKRIKWDRIVVLSTDRDGFTDEVYEQWKQISFPKVLFSAEKRDDPSVIWFPKYAKEGMVGDLIPAREYYKKNHLIKIINESYR